MPHRFPGRPRAAAVGSLALAFLGCRAVTGAEREDPARCPQTYEFGNVGCARFVALVDGPASPPRAYRVDVRAVPARPQSGFDMAVASGTALGAVPLQLTRWLQGASGTGDTVTVWLVARMLDDAGPIVVGVPLPTVAAESTVRVVRFTPVGARVPVDTVHFTLRRMSSAAP